MPGVTIKGLTKRYGDVAAVEGLSLEVQPSELVSLLGPSGCGKTTTLRLVAGFLRPEAGEIWVGERCLSSPTGVVPPERRRMAMIFHSYALWPHMTVAQYVTHDQGEAMVISDRVAVLYRGRVVQVGTAEDLFQRPRTRFVAEFIGKTNLVDGVTVEPGVVARGGLRLRVAVTGLKPGAPVAVSIRPHEIILVTGDRAAPPGHNVLTGVVQRTSYLGDAVDYQVRVNESDVTLRVTAPTSIRLRPGMGVRLAVAPEACEIGRASCRERV